jgi:hypothetical protein
MERRPFQFFGPTRSISADTATRGAPIAIAGQGTGSSIQAATTVTTPGAASR